MNLSRLTPARVLWTLWVAALIAVAIGSLLPQLGVSDRYDLDKFVHAGAYLLLAFWPMLALQDKRKALLFFLAIVLTSAMIELLQADIPERVSSIADFAANAMGASVGSLLGRMLRRQKRLAFLQR